MSSRNAISIQKRVASSDAGTSFAPDDEIGFLLRRQFWDPLRCSPLYVNIRWNHNLSDFFVGLKDVVQWRAAETLCTYVDTACGEILQDVVRAHWQAFIRDIKPLRVGSFGTRSLGLNVLDDYCERTLLYAYKHYPHETTCFSQVPLIQADPCVSASFSKLEESELRNLSTRTIRREFDRLCHTVSRTSYDRSNARCILKNTVKHPSAAWIVAVQTLHDTIVPAEMTQLAEKLVPLLALFAAVDMTKEKGRRHPSEPEVRIPSKEFLASIGAWRRAGKDPLQQEVIAAFIDDLWPDNGEYIDNSHGNLGMFAGMRMILLERKEFHPHPQDQSLLAEIESLAASPRVYLDATGRLHESAAPRVVPVIQVTAKLHTRDLRALFRGSYEALLLNLLFRTPVVHSTLSELLFSHRVKESRKLLAKLGYESAVAINARRRQCERELVQHLAGVVHADPRFDAISDSIDMWLCKLEDGEINAEEALMEILKACPPELALALDQEFCNWTDILDTLGLPYTFYWMPPGIPPPAPVPPLELSELLPPPNPPPPGPNTKAPISHPVVANAPPPTNNFSVSMPVPSTTKKKGTRRSSKRYKEELDAQLGPIRGTPRQCRGCGKVLSTVCNRSRHEWTEHMPKVSCPYKKYGCRAEMGRRMDYTHKHCQVCPYNPNRLEAASDDYNENSPTVQAAMVTTPNIVTPETSPESLSTPLDNSVFTPNSEISPSYDVPLLSMGWWKSSSDSTPIDTPENGYMGTGLDTGSIPSKPEDDFDIISLFELPPSIMEGLTGGEDGSLDEFENFDFLMK